MFGHNDTSLQCLNYNINNKIQHDITSEQLNTYKLRIGTIGSCLQNPLLGASDFKWTLFFFI